MEKNSFVSLLEKIDNNIKLLEEYYSDNSAKPDIATIYQFRSFVVDVLKELEKKKHKPKVANWELYDEFVLWSDVKKAIKGDKK